MDSQYAPRLRSARTVCRVLSKRPNDVAARLDQLIKIVRIRITSGYGMLLSPQCFDIACIPVLQFDAFCFRDGDVERFAAI